MNSLDFWFLHHSRKWERIRNLRYEPYDTYHTWNEFLLWFWISFFSDKACKELDSNAKRRSQCYGFWERSIILNNLRHILKNWIFWPIRFSRKANKPFSVEFNFPYGLAQGSQCDGKSLNGMRFWEIISLFDNLWKQVAFCWDIQFHPGKKPIPEKSPYRMGHTQEIPGLKILKKSPMPGI